MISNTRVPGYPDTGTLYRVPIWYPDRMGARQPVHHPGPDEREVQARCERQKADGQVEGFCALLERRVAVLTALMRRGNTERVVIGNSNPWGIPG